MFVAAIRGYRSPYPAESDSKANTWTKLTGLGTGGSGANINYVLSPTTDAAQTFTTDGGDVGTQYSGAGIVGFSGITAFDAKSAGSADVTGAPFNPGSLTPAAGGEVFISVLGFTSSASDSVLSIDSGFTIVYQGYTSAGAYGFAVAYKVKSAGDTTAENPTWTKVSGTGTITASCLQAAFKP